MQIRYCESCGMKLPALDAPASTKTDLCEKCAGERAQKPAGSTQVLAQPTSRKSSATRLSAIKTATAVTERPSRRTPAGGAPIAPSTAAPSPVAPPAPPPSASGQDESGSASSTVNMGFYFCEKCGKRVTAADLAAGRARDKQLRGVHCGSCAEGALTLAFDAISQQELLKDEQNRRLLDRRSSSTRLSGSKAIAGVPSRRSRLHRAASRSPVLAIGVGCAVLALVAAAAFLFMRSGTTAAAKPNPDAAAVKPVNTTAVLPAAVIASSTAATQPPPAATNPLPKTAPAVPPDMPDQGAQPDVKPPGDPAQVKTDPGPTGEPTPPSPTDAEGKASLAFDELKASLKQLAEDNDAGRTALCEAFLKEHGTTIIAARARTMMAQPRKAPTVNASTRATPGNAGPAAGPLETVVPESKDYQLVYDLDLAKLAKEIVYDQDLRAKITKKFDRIAYFIELQRNGENAQYLYVSMDAFTTDLGKIGVPALATGATFQQNVANMNVHSNVQGIVTGEGITGGNIEFWPNNYWSGNATGVPNAGRGYDFGDTIKGGPDGIGSMQVHNHDARQTLFAINNWKGGSAADIGIGNNPNAQPDWTFANNAASYSVKRLRVLVRCK